MTTDYKDRDTQDLLDKIEGLECDLHEAVSVALSRGASEWAKLNYPDHPKVREMAHAPSAQPGSTAAPGVALGKLLKAPEAVGAKVRGAGDTSEVRALKDELSALHAMRLGGKAPACHLEGLSPEEIENQISLVGGMLSEARMQGAPLVAMPDMELLMKVARAVALRERAACRAAVGGAWAKIQGTPYAAGPRKFCEAIDRMPDVNDTSINDLSEDIL